MFRLLVMAMFAVLVLILLANVILGCQPQNDVVGERVLHWLDQPGWLFWTDGGAIRLNLKNSTLTVAKGWVTVETETFYEKDLPQGQWKLIQEKRAVIHEKLRKDGLAKQRAATLAALAVPGSAKAKLNQQQPKPKRDAADILKLIDECDYYLKGSPAGTAALRRTKSHGVDVTPDWVVVYSAKGDYKVPASEFSAEAWAAIQEKVKAKLAACDAAAKTLEEEKASSSWPSVAWVLGGLLAVLIVAAIGRVRCLPLLMFLPASSLQAQPATTAKVLQTTQQLIAELGADDFARRERAYKQLSGMGRSILGQLREASQDTDCPERARRAYLIVGRLQAAWVAARLLEIEADGWMPWIDAAGYVVETGYWDQLPCALHEYMPVQYSPPYQIGREATRWLVRDMLREDVPVILIRRMLAVMRAAEEAAWQRTDWGDDARPPGWKKP